MSKKEALKILQIEKSNPSKEEIKKQYLLLAKKYHPDVNLNDKIFKNLFVHLNEAYKSLLKNEFIENRPEENIRSSNGKYKSVCCGCNKLILLTENQYLRLKHYGDEYNCISCRKYIEKSTSRRSKIKFLSFIFSSLITILIIFALVMLFLHNSHKI